MAEKYHVPRFGPGTSIPRAWGRALRASLAHWRANRPGFWTEPESVHQARVALRRLRALLRLGEALELVKLDGGLARRLRVLGRALGEVRDRDVLLDGPPLPSSARRRTVRKREKSLVRAQALARANAPAFRTLAVLRPRDPSDAPRRFERALNRLWRRVRRRGRDLDRRGARRLHRLRVATKRLRYTLDSFTPFLAPEYRRRLARLKDLQKILGEVNDVENRFRFLNGLLSRSALTEERRLWRREDPRRREALREVWRRLGPD